MTGPNPHDEAQPLPPEGGSTPPPERPQKGLRLRARWRLVRASARTLLWVVVGLVVVAAFFLRTSPGHHLLLGWGVDQLRSRVAGTVEIAEVRSADLLSGARLVGVRLATPDGATFVEADSVEASYSWRGLLGGGLAFDGVRIWNPRVVLERDSAGIDTLDRWLHGDRPPPADGGGGGIVLVLRSAQIVGGSFALRLPASPEEDGVFRTTRGADGVVRRALDLTELDARIPRLELGGAAGLRVDIDEAGAELALLERPFPIEGVRGTVQVVGGQVDADLSALRAPGIEGRGRVRVDRGDTLGMVTEIEAVLARADLAEWQWLADALPDMAGALTLAGRIGPEGQRWALTGVDATWEGGEVRGGGTVHLAAGPLRLDDVDLEVEGVPVTALDPFLADPLGVAGDVTGRLRLDGPLTDLRVEGELALRTGRITQAVARFDGGILRRAGDVAFRAFRVDADPLEWGVVGEVVRSVPFEGPGRATVELNGSLGEGLSFTGDLGHTPPDVAATHLLVSGSVFLPADDRLRMDIQGHLSPLSLDALLHGNDSLDLPLGGTLTGLVRARGVVDDLEIRAGLTAAEGRLDLTGRVDLQDPASGYRIDATLTDFLVSAFAATLPTPTEVTGRLHLEGSGFEVETAAALASLEVSEGMVNGVRIDSARAALRLAERTLLVDSVQASVAGIALVGGGTLAAEPAAPAGVLRLDFAADDLTGIRAIFRGDTVLTSEGLTPLDRDVLTLAGIDPDTLPPAAEVVAEGRLRGEVVLEGALTDFSLRGWGEADDVAYGRTTVGSARVEMSATGLPSLTGGLHAEVAVGPTVFAGRTFTSGTAALDFTHPAGRAEIELQRDSTEDYRLAGRFELDSLGGTVDVEEASIRLDSLRYRTRHPSRIRWTDSVLAIDSLTLEGVGADPVRIRAAGVLPRRGEADFHVDLRDLDVQRLTRVIQREDLEWSGRVDFTGRVQGTADRPIASGDLSARDLSVRNVSIDRLEGKLDHAGREVAVDLDVRDGGRRVLRVEGDWPFAFTLDGSTPDVSDHPVALTVTADSLPAALVLALLEDLEDTRGTISGRLAVGGTARSLEPRGVLELNGGAWTVGALGVRQQQVEAVFDVQADRIVEVEARGRSGGTVEVRGRVTLDSLTSPGLDLDIALSSFNAVDRRDIAGAVSGALELQGRYGQPRILGTLQVERGDLFLDEFARNVGVVDLSDPRFFTFIGEELLTSRPLLAETRNPFMDNLLVNIDLAVERNAWIRSDQLDVEMRGELIVTYDRRSRDVVMIGELEAVRGQYQFLGQNFEVQGGTVEFIGIPGINPDMNIQALARVRRRQGEPLDITAQVGGTLIEPRVELTTPDAAVSESDILSYIAVGQPASALTTDVSAAAGGFVGGFVGGSLTSSLTALAQGSSWIDFLSISQAFDASTVGAGAQGIGQSFAGTQVELGRYFGGDYFAALIIRPLASAGGTGSVLGGARIEWQASPQYFLEVFAEDRFLRTGAFGFREFDIESRLIFGFSLFREWGY